mgnify:FL=1
MESDILCYVCGNKSNLIYQDYPGYVEGTKYHIYHCPDCNTNFIDQNSIDISIYDLIYSQKKVLGYDRYFNYAEKVKTEKNPLKYLAFSESMYYPVYRYLKGKKNLRILEVGCGNGYLSYSMNKLGHNVTGIDLSANAIANAKKNYGNYFVNSSVEDFSKNNNEKYDLIVSTEVIEHVKNPVLFFKELYHLLNKNGTLILTTPDMGFTKNDSIWFTDLPPVHLFWFSYQSFQQICTVNKYKYKFFNYKTYFPKNDNRLVRYFRFRNESIQNPLLNKEGVPIDNYDLSLDYFPRKQIKNILLKFPPVRFITNLFYNLLINKDITLCIMVTKE